MNDDHTWLTLTDDQLTDRFASVTVWQANSQRAPHKPSSAKRGLTHSWAGRPVHTHEQILNS